MALKSGKPFQIFIQSPNPQIPTQTLTLPTTNPSLQTIKSLLFPKTPNPNSFFLTLNGKLISNSTQITPLSTLTLHFRLSGGGGDGGSTCAESRDCFLNMYKGKVPDKADPNEIRLSKFINCSLSNEPLRRPIVIDKLGNLFNKEALVEGLLKKSLPKQYGYIKGLKDMISVELDEIKGDREDKGVRFQCPITGQEFNGMYRFYAIRKCGHVLSAKGLKEIKTKACLVCHEEFEESDKIVINGSEEEVKELWEKLKEEKATRVVGGKDVNGKKSKKVENGRVSGTKHGMEVNGGKGNGMGLSKKLKVAEEDPEKDKATSAVYASIFTSSKKKSDFRETYSCRSLPLGRN